MTMTMTKKSRKKKTDYKCSAKSTVGVDETIASQQGETEQQETQNESIQGLVGATRKDLQDIIEACDMLGLGSENVSLVYSLETMHGIAKCLSILLEGSTVENGCSFMRHYKPASVERAKKFRKAKLVPRSSTEIPSIKELSSGFFHIDYSCESHLRYLGKEVLTISGTYYRALAMFNSIAEEHQAKHGKQPVSLLMQMDRLKAEMNKLYILPGGPDVLDKLSKDWKDRSRFETAQKLFLEADDNKENLGKVGN